MPSGYCPFFNPHTNFCRLFFIKLIFYSYKINYHDLPKAFFSDHDDDDDNNGAFVEQCMLIIIIISGKII